MIRDVLSVLNRIKIHRMDRHSGHFFVSHQIVANPIDNLQHFDGLTVCDKAPIIDLIDIDNQSVAF